MTKNDPEVACRPDPDSTKIPVAQDDTRRQMRNDKIR